MEWKAVFIGGPCASVRTGQTCIFHTEEDERPKRLDMTSFSLNYDRKFDGKETPVIYEHVSGDEYKFVES